MKQTELVKEIPCVSFPEDRISVGINEASPQVIIVCQEGNGFAGVVLDWESTVNLIQGLMSALHRIGPK